MSFRVHVNFTRPITKTLCTTNLLKHNLKDSCTSVLRETFPAQPWRPRRYLSPFSKLAYLLDVTEATQSSSYPRPCQECGSQDRSNSPASDVKPFPVVAIMHRSQGFDDGFWTVYMYLPSRD